MKKKNKGITLIALVITIIVLLILAGVAIAMLSGENGILKKAAEAKTKTDEAQENETKDLQALEYLLKKNTGERCWQYKKDSNGRKTIVTDGVVELPIGTYINYDPTKDEKGNEIEKTITSNAGSPIDKDEYKASEKTLTEGNGYGLQTFSNKATTNGWQLLGVDERTGELLVISASLIQTVENKDFNLQGIAGYIYGESELNKVCSVFGYGKGATGARSVNVDDVNKITGYNPNNVGVYDPEQKGLGIKSGAGKVYEYGNKVTYSWTSTQNEISYKGSNENTGTRVSDNYTTYGFNWYDIESKKWKNSMQNTTDVKEITSLTDDYYTYYADSLKENNETEQCNGLERESNEYKLLFGKRGGVEYWLASSCVHTVQGGAIYYIRQVLGGQVLAMNALYYSTLYSSLSNASRIRPVVSLKSDVVLEKGADETYNII